MAVDDDEKTPIRHPSIELILLFSSSRAHLHHLASPIDCSAATGSSVKPLRGAAAPAAAGRRVGDRGRGMLLELFFQSVGRAIDVFGFTFLGFSSFV